MILGIDEAGRGPWAGPLVVGAVVLGEVEIDGLTDSKKLTKKRREALYEVIIDQAAAVATGWVSASELDEWGMSRALQVATRRAVEQIRVPYHQIIIDGRVNFLADTTKGRYVTTLVKADLLIASVSAASVVAKVERDRYMAGLDELYPGYGFANHAGYGVAKHRLAIDRLGVCAQHRLSFAPLRRYQGLSTVAPRPARRVGTSRQVGDESEEVACQTLVQLGHEIIERNWKTKVCEIDIVSLRDGIYYFTEVKHRQSDWAGDGLAAVTSRKLAQMKFAARVYVHNHQLGAVEMRLMAIATSGSPPVVSSQLEID